eukprot:gene9576-9738_t
MSAEKLGGFSLVVLLLSTAAALSRAAIVDYLNPWHWDTATEGKALQLLEANGLLPAGAAKSVFAAAVASNPKSQFSGKYLVTFTVGIGCALWTLNNDTTACPAAGCPAAIVAIGQVPPSGVITNESFPCTFAQKIRPPLGTYKELPAKG